MKVEFDSLGIRKKAHWRAMNKWTIEIQEKDTTWPGLFKITGGTFPLVCGWEGEEGIYCDRKEDLLLMASAPELKAKLTIAVEVLEKLERDNNPVMHGNENISGYCREILKLIKPA